jgi:hypothetical protein
MKKIMMLFLLVGSFTAGKAQSKASLEKFWSSFQPLLVAKKFKALEAHTQFPLTSRGVLDDIKELKISKAKFAEAMGNFLAIDDPNLNDTKMNTYKQWTKLPTGNEVSLSGNWARINDMEFKFVKGKWILTLIYDGRTE